jgi:hypothetical protein
VGRRFYYLLFSTSLVELIKFGYQHELVSFCVF